MPMRPDSSPTIWSPITIIVNTKSVYRIGHIVFIVINFASIYAFKSQYFIILSYWKYKWFIFVFFFTKLARPGDVRVESKYFAMLRFYYWKCCPYAITLLMKHRWRKTISASLEKKRYFTFFWKYLK